MSHNNHMLKKQSAFTLIELLIVLVLFAAMITAGMVQYNRLVRQADEATVKAFTSILRAAATITYAQVALGDIPGCTIQNITIKTVYDNLENKGDIRLSGNDYFVARINDKQYRWKYKPPLTVGEGEEY